MQYCNILVHENHSIEPINPYLVIMRTLPTQTSNHPFIKLICKDSDGAHHVINQIDMCKGDDDFRFKLFAKHLERAEWTFLFHGKPRVSLHIFYTQNIHNHNMGRMTI